MDEIAPAEMSEKERDEIIGKLTELNGELVHVNEICKIIPNASINTLRGFLDINTDTQEFTDFVELKRLIEKSQDPFGYQNEESGW